MYIKLLGNLINLDLIKKISEVQAHLVDKNGDEKQYPHFTEMRGDDEERWLKRLEDKDDKYAQTQRMAYVFKIYYLNERGYEIIDGGDDKEKAIIARDKFVEFLNNNQTVIHEIKL